jgi:hypothetical protein
MAGIREVFDRPRLAGAEDDGFRARSTSAVPRQALSRSRKCGDRTNLGSCLTTVSFEEISFSYGPGSTGSGGIVVI